MRVSRAAPMSNPGNSRSEGRKAMKVKYHPRFVEKVLLAEIQRREKRGDCRLRDQYHELAEPLYALAPEARDEGFKEIYIGLFIKCGLHSALEEILHESPVMEKIDETIIFESGGEELADLYQDKDRLRVVMNLKASSLSDATRLRSLMNHELTHLADMLDPQFCYDRSPFSSSPAEESILRERYRTLWDISIDSRLLKSDQLTIATKALRQEEFLALYRKFGQRECEAVFEHLWSRGRMTHPELREHAKDPHRLLRAAGIEVAENTVLPGLLCPICGFPTYEWVANPGQIEGCVTDQIKQHVPDWTPQQGICERCLESWTYRTRESNEDSRRAEGG
jgi:hypothetical protein